MKKVLLISYHSFPLNVVASNRTKAYCDYFIENDIWPVLITTNWEFDDNKHLIYHDDKENIIHNVFGNYEEYRLPNITSEASTGGSLKKFKTFNHLLNGYFDTDLKSTYLLYQSFLVNHLSKNKYDFILAIFSPHFHLRLAFELNQIFKIPYSLDFRDLWENTIVSKSYSPSIKEKLINSITKYWWKKWLSNARFFSTTSSKWVDFINQFSPVKGYIIKNGLDFKYQNLTSNSTDRFNIIHFGRVYPTQNFNVFFNAFKELLKYGNENDIRLTFIGLPKVSKEWFLDYLVEELPEQNYECLEKMTKVDLYEYCKEKATLFFQPGFKEDTGAFNVKVYEYASIGKLTILAPDDGSLVSDFLIKTNSGEVFNEEYILIKRLKELYDEWKLNNKVNYSPLVEKLNSYHRKYQVSKMANLIKSIE